MTKAIFEVARVAEDTQTVRDGDGMKIDLALDHEAWTQLCKVVGQIEAQSRTPKTADRWRCEMRLRGKDLRQRMNGQVSPGYISQSIVYDCMQPNTLYRLEPPFSACAVQRWQIVLKIGRAIRSLVDF